MPPAGRVDEDDVELLRRGVADGVFGDVRGVFAVAFLVELNFPEPLSFRELFQVASVHAELLDRARPESIAGRDEEVEVVLKEEERQFGEVG